jgi:basic membrane protein A and related proteins
MSQWSLIRRLSALAFGLAIAIPAAQAAEKPVALIIAQGGLGDKSYNDLAYKGFEKALAETGLQGKAVESKDVVAQAENILRTAAGPGGFGLIVDLEYSHGETLKTVARDYPGVDFVILNEVEPGANVASVVFKEQEGSYLAGALAAMVAADPKIKGVGPTPIIGAIGGIKSPGIDKFLVGYIQGAHAIDPKVAVKIAYSNNFGDPAIGYQMAKAMFDQGASVVYQVAGGTGIGVIRAAKETGHFAIGVDTDQDGMAPGSVLTSMIKRTDLAVETVIKDYAAHKFPGGRVVTLGLKEDGVSLSPMTYTKSLIPAADLRKIAALKREIVAGKIKVWDVTSKEGYPAWFK